MALTLTRLNTLLSLRALTRGGLQVLRGVRYKPRQLLAGASVRTRFLASVSEVYTEFTNLHLSDEKHAFWLVMGLAVFDQVRAPLSPSLKAKTQRSF